jgi:hypothetical protein
MNYDLDDGGYEQSPAEPTPCMRPLLEVVLPCGHKALIKGPKPPYVCILEEADTGLMRVEFAAHPERRLALLQRGNSREIRFAWIIDRGLDAESARRACAQLLGMYGMTPTPTGWFSPSEHFATVLASWREARGLIPTDEGEDDVRGPMPEFAFVEGDAR